MAQWVKDPAFATVTWLDPWPGNFHVLWEVPQPKKKKKDNQDITPESYWMVHSVC